MKLSPTHKQRLARDVRKKHGLELTPDQAESELVAAMQTIRQRMIEKGHAEFATMSDEEVYAIVREAHQA